MQRPFRLFFLTWIVCWGFIFQVNAQENYEIRSIDFHGNKTLDKESLLEGMALKELPYMKKILTKEEPSLYNRELIQIDLERFKADLSARRFSECKSQTSTVNH